MIEFDRMKTVEHMFPDWREHLSDGKMIDHILEGLACQKIVFNKCSRPGCNYVARRGRKTCIECAAKAAQYMRAYGRRKVLTETKSTSTEADSGQKPKGVLSTQIVM